MNYLISANFDYALRIVLACLCGICIGWERKNRAKEAGVRTHCIVACGSALMMIISKYGFTDISSHDASRVAAQIVSGIGFLGAGMIFVHKNTITGLTTAAGVWATAGIGMAFGAGMYAIGFFTTGVILIIQIVLHRNSKLTQVPKLVKFSLAGDGKPDFQGRMYSQFDTLDIHVYSTEVANNAETGEMRFTFKLEVPADIKEEILVEKYKGSKVSPC